MSENVQVALWVRLEARPGKEQAVAEFLRGGLPLVQKEPATITWFGLTLFRMKPEDKPTSLEQWLPP